MSTADRRPYLSATTLNQSFLDDCQDSLSNQLELIVDIETPLLGTTIYASDRNKYVDGVFYEALLVFPTISRTIGEWLSNEVEFSTLTLEINNSDGRFNYLLPGGASFGSWIGKSVEVKLGLRNVGSTYFRIFKGFVTDVGGFSRGTHSFTLVARDQYDKLNVNFPTTAFSPTTYADIAEDVAGKTIPVIYGDWTTNITSGAASIPANVVNGADPTVLITEENVTISIASPGVFTLSNHRYQANDEFILDSDGTLPSPLVAGSNYFIKTVLTADTFTISTTAGGAEINTSGAQSGTHTVKSALTTGSNIKLVISENDLTSFDTSSVYLKRSDNYYLFTSAEIVNVGAGNKSFEITQGVLVIDGNPFAYTSGDQFYVKVKGKDLGSYDDNIVSQAKDLLVTFGGLVDPTDFDTTWTTYRDKASPTESAISTFKSRIWIQEPQPVIQYVNSLLEQVRLEAFIDRNLKVKINALHFDSFVASPTFEVKNWDIEKNSFKPKLDERNNFNRARGVFNFLPDTGEEAQVTSTYRNSAAITAAGKEISKQIVFPNLYDSTVVANQVKEILKLASSYLEVIETSLTWRSTLKDIGDFVQLNVSIGGLVMTDVPAMIRDIGYDPEGLKIPVKLWSFMMCPFSGYTPGYAGTTGGSTATITEE